MCHRLIDGSWVGCARQKRSSVHVKVGRLCTLYGLASQRRSLFSSFCTRRLCTSARPDVAVVCARRRPALQHATLPFDIISFDITILNITCSALSFATSSASFSFFQQVYHSTHLLLQHYNFQPHPFLLLSIIILNHDCLHFIFRNHFLIIIPFNIISNNIQHSSCESSWTLSFCIHSPQHPHP